MSSQPAPRSSGIVAEGLLTGLLVWMTYASVEFVFCSLALVLLFPGVTFSPWYWPLTAELAASYAVLGAVLGALGGILAARNPRDSGRRLRSWAILTLPAVFLIHAGRAGKLDHGEMLTCIAAAALVIVQALNLRSAAWFKAIGKHATAWLTSFILVGLPWANSVSISHERLWSDSRLWRVVMLAGVVAGIGLLNMARRRLAAHRRSLATPAYWRQAALPAAVAVTTAVASLAFASGLSSDKPMAAAGAHPASPNIVLITMDTVRADHLPLYGYGRDTAPNLAAFASQATLYRRAMAVSNLTLTTHATLFTGVYPSSHGAYADPPRYHVGRPLSPKIPTVAEMLGQRGYRTIGIAANYGYLQPYFALDRGFQIYDARMPVTLLEPLLPKLYLRYAMRRVINLFGSTSDFDLGIRRGDEINKETFRLLDQVSRRKDPFFLFVNYMEAHEPYLPPSPYDRMFPGKLPNFSHESFQALHESVTIGRRQITPPVLNHLVSQYDGGIACLDARIAELFAHLKRRGVYDDSLIVVLSDHGEFFGERHLLAHGVTLYNPVVDIPLIVKYPHQREAKAVDDLVSQIDIAPTILEAAGIPRPASFAGQSLMHAVDSGRYLYSESFPPSFDPPWPQEYRKTERAAYIKFDKLIQSSLDEREFYDLRADPQETRNLYRRDSPLVASLQSALGQWMSRQQKFVSGRSEPARVLQQLKSLGYVQ